LLSAPEFAREFLPGEFDEIRHIFSKRKAYSKFRALLMRQNALEHWYGFESKATKQILREWYAVNSIEVTDEHLAALRSSRCRSLPSAFC
jgi:hypothetical protein